MYRRSFLRYLAAAAAAGIMPRVAMAADDDLYAVGKFGNVRLLHTMPAGSTTGVGASAATLPPGNPGSALPGTFGQRFREALKGEVGKRFNRPDGRDQ